MRGEVPDIYCVNSGMTFFFLLLLFVSGTWVGADWGTIPCVGEYRSAGESDCTVCPQGKKCMSEAVARAEQAG